MAVRAGAEFDDSDDEDSVDSDEERDVEDYWIAQVSVVYTVADQVTTVANTCIPAGTEYMVFRWLIHDEDVLLGGGARQFKDEGQRPSS